MRILTAQYQSSAELLGNFNPVFEGGALFYETRVPLATGEPVIIDVRIPEISNPVLVRGKVAYVGPAGTSLLDPERGGRWGAWVAIDEEDRATRDFLLGVASRLVGAPTARRRARRFPVELPVDWQVGEADDVYISSTEDLSWGGVFVRTAAPPPVGTPIRLRITVREQLLSLRGRVARTRLYGGAGMAVRFTGENDERRRLRQLLREMSVRGELALAS
jgi:Tfp pilus assembly protein PilZ